MMDVGPLNITLYDKSVYTFPIIAKIVGWILAVSSVLMVPIIGIKTISSYSGTLRQVKNRNYIIFFLFYLNRMLNSINCLKHFTL